MAIPKSDDFSHKSLLFERIEEKDLENAAKKKIVHLKIAADQLDRISQVFPFIPSLQLSQYGKKDHKACIENIQKIQPIRHIEHCTIDMIEDREFLQALFQSPHQKLTHFSISFPTNIWKKGVVTPFDEEMEILSKNSPSLSHFHAEGIKIQKEALGALIHSLQSLSLRLSEIADSAFGELKNFTNLEQLELYQCDGLSLDRFFHLLQKSPRLYFLRVLHTFVFSNEEVKKIATLCPLLTTVSLKARGINDDGLSTLATKCNQLRNIVLEGTAQITDRSIEVLAKKCTELSGLWFLREEDPSQITDASIDLLVTKCKLKKLIIFNENKLTQESLKSINSSFFLKEVYIEGLDEKNLRSDLFWRAEEEDCYPPMDEGIDDGDF